jgi:hypothetical protein
MTIMTAPKENLLTLGTIRAFQQTEKALVADPSSERLRVQNKFMSI